jgi:hypothetical protein
VVGQALAQHVTVSTGAPSVMPAEFDAWVITNYRPIDVKTAINESVSGQRA